ncbi:MAG: hypothetical protein RI911_169 [Candidatus Parcubacteria bacterium]|jgi:predicted patatin/cPLA2 family phospholipase
MRDYELSRERDISIDGEPHRVVPELFEYSIARKEGASTSLRPCIMALSGGNRGVNSGATFAALESLGMSKAAKYLIGSSAGYAGVLYYAAGNAQQGVKHFSQYCTSPDFFNIRRLGNQVNIPGLVQQFKSSEERALRLNPNASIRSGIQIFTPLTNAETGATLLFSPRTASDVMKSLQAAMSLPGLTEQAVHIDGVRYVDSSLADPFPFMSLLKVLAPEDVPTSILILANRPRTYDRKGRELLAKFMEREHVDPQLISLALQEEELFEANMRELKGSGIPFCIIWSDDTLPDFTSKRELIGAAELKMSKVATSMFLHYRPERRD